MDLWAYPSWLFFLFSLPRTQVRRGWRGECCQYPYTHLWLLSRSTAQTESFFLNLAPMGRATGSSTPQQGWPWIPTGTSSWPTGATAGSRYTGRPGGGGGVARKDSLVPAWDSHSLAALPPLHLFCLAVGTGGQHQQGNEPARWSGNGSGSSSGQLQKGQTSGTLTG